MSLIVDETKGFKVEMVPFTVFSDIDLPGRNGAKLEPMSFTKDEEVLEVTVTGCIKDNAAATKHSANVSSQSVSWTESDLAIDYKTARDFAKPLMVTDAGKAV